MALVNTTVSIGLEVTSSTGRIDPTTLTLQVTTPSNTTLTYTYGVNSEVVRDGVGLFHFSLLLSTVGTYSYLWTVAGNVNATDAGEIEVTNPAQNVTILTRNAVGAVPVPAVTVEVRLGGVLVGAGVSNASGSLELPLTAGVYSVVGRKDGWSFTAYQATVLGLQPPDAEEITITGGNLNVGSAATQKCLLHGFTTPGVSVLVETSPGYVAGGPSVAHRDVFTGRSRLALRSNASGYWEAETQVGSRVTVTMPESGVNKSFRVPNKASLNIADITAELTEKSP